MVVALIDLRANDRGMVGERKGVGASHSATVPDMVGAGTTGCSGCCPESTTTKGGVREPVGEVNSPLRESTGSTKRGE